MKKFLSFSLFPSVASAARGLDCTLGSPAIAPEEFGTEQRERRKQASLGERKCACPSDRWSMLFSSMASLLDIKNSISPRQRSARARPPSSLATTTKKSPWREGDAGVQRRASLATRPCKKMLCSLTPSFERGGPSEERK